MNRREMDPLEALVYRSVGNGFHLFLLLLELHPPPHTHTPRPFLIRFQRFPNTLRQIFKGHRQGSMKSVVSIVLLVHCKASWFCSAAISIHYIAIHPAVRSGMSASFYCEIQLYYTIIYSSVAFPVYSLSKFSEFPERQTQPRALWHHSSQSHLWLQT